MRPVLPLERVRQEGRITVLAFYSNSCPSVRRLRESLASLTHLRPDVAIRMVNLGERWGGRDYQALYGVNILSVPHVMIYGPDGRLLDGDDGRDKTGLKRLHAWLTEELKRSHERANAAAE